MRLSAADLKDTSAWKVRGYVLPEFDREKVIKNTQKAPMWVHFGGGNIFRGFLADIMQEVLDQRAEERGIIVASGNDSIDYVYRKTDNLGLNVILKNDGTFTKKVIGSITESVKTDPALEDWERLQSIFRAPSLQMASFTITEKAYKLVGADGLYTEAVLEDFEKGPQNPVSYMGRIASLCYTRFLEGELPFSLVSMDNYSHNGTQLHASIHAFAEEWEKRRLVKAGFMAYIDAPQKVGFPWTMIDKITPSPNENVKKILEKDGLEGLDTIITARKTVMAPFVNVEETGYLVIEDRFPNGHPPLEKGGVIFTDAATVDKAEKMKVCTCLNPLHSSLAIFGCLLGYQRIWKEMQDVQLVNLIKKIGYEEGLPVVIHPGILDPKQFIDTVVQVRFPNPFLPDSPQRIAIDLSQKIPIRFGETVKAYMRDENRSASSLRYIPLVFAGYLRYLLGVDDEGSRMEPSSDPMKETLQEQLSGIHLGQQTFSEEILRPILSNKALFGVDLYEAGLAGKVADYLRELIQGPGAVRRTLIKYVGEGGIK